MTEISLTVAIRDFLFEKSGAGRSLHTIADYRNYLNTFDSYIGERDLLQVTSPDVNSFLNYMQNEYRVRRAGVPTDKTVSVKTIANIQAMLNVFWGWAGTTYQRPLYL